MSKERPVGELITSTKYMGEYIGIREREREDGQRVAKLIVSGTDPDVVEGIVRRDMELYGHGGKFRYYFYKPFQLGEDREGQIIENGVKR